MRGVVVPSDGAVVPSDGAVVLGEADGSGLAAETTATPPATSSSPEIAAVRTARRMPLVVFVSAGRGLDGRGGCRFERLEGGFHAELLALRMGRPTLDEPHPERGDAPERRVRTMSSAIGRD